MTIERLVGLPTSNEINHYNHRPINTERPSSL